MQHIRWNTYTGYSLIEMMIAFLVVSVMVLSLMMVIKSSIEEKHTTRLKLHQHITLTNLSLMFRSEAAGASAVAADTNNTWIMFENDDYIVRYLLDNSSGQGDFVREVSNKAAPLPTVLTDEDNLPAGWAGRPMTRVSTIGQFPGNMQTQVNFTCPDPCFELINGSEIFWHAPGVETVTPAGNRTRVTEVFGEMRVGLRDVVVVRNVGTFIP